MQLINVLIKRPLAIAKAALHVRAVHLFVCLSVWLSPKYVQKRDFLKKTNLSNLDNYMVSIRPTQSPTWAFHRIQPIKFKMADGRHFKNRFLCHNSAADCPISVKFCVGSIFSQNFGSGTDSRVPQKLFCFPNAVWVSASGGFRIVSDTLVYTDLQ